MPVSFKVGERSQVGNRVDGLPGRTCEALRLAFHPFV